jgi:hypothetical protein
MTRNIRVIANIEVDLEVIFKNVFKEYECENVDELQMDYVIEYINNNITYLEGKGVDFISSCEWLCSSIDGIDDRDWEYVEKELEKFIENNR